MITPDLKDKAFALLTEHWDVYEDVNDMLDDLLDLGIDEPESDEILESYKTEMGVELPKHEVQSSYGRGTEDDIFLRVGTLPYVNGPNKLEVKPPDIEKYKEKLKGAPSKAKEPESTSKKFNFKQDDGIVILGKRGCLPLDEWVYTPSGAVQVKEIKDGDIILGGQVAERFSYVAPVFTLELGNVKFRASGEHPIFIRKYPEDEGRWMAVEDIYKHYTNKKSANTRWYAEFLDSKAFKMETISVGLPMAKLLGYLMSDGSISEVQSIKFTNVRRTLLEEVSILGATVGAKYGFSIKSYPKGNSEDLLFVGATKRTHNFFKDELRRLGVIDRNSFGKIQMLAEDELKEFLKGYFNGDGTLDISHKFPRINFYVGVSERQAHELRFILWRLGIRSTISHRVRKLGHKGCWEVRIYEKEGVKKLLDFLDDVKYPDKFSRAKEMLSTIDKDRQHRSVTNGISVPIKSVSKGEPETVVGWNTWPSHEIVSHMGLRTHNSGKSNLIRFLVTTLKDLNFVVLDAIRNLRDLADKPNVVDYRQLNPADTKTANEIIGEALETGNVMVVIDEVDRYKTTPGTKLSDLVNLGRNYNVGYLAAARRTARIDKDVLAGATWTFVFKHILPQDLEVLTEWFGVDERTFRELADHEVILFHEDVEVWRGVVKYIPAPAHVKPPPDIGEAPDKGKKPKEPEDKKPPQPPVGEGAEPEAPEGGVGEPAEKTEEGIRCPACESMDTVPLNDDYQICLNCEYEWVPKRLHENFVEGDEKLSKVCPKCGNKNIYWEGGHLHCPRCGNIF